MTLNAGEMTMWRLVQLYTGRVGYQRGIPARHEIRWTIGRPSGH